MCTTNNLSQESFQYWKVSSCWVIYVGNHIFGNGQEHRILQNSYDYNRDVSICCNQHNYIKYVPIPSNS